LSAISQDSKKAEVRKRNAESFKMNIRKNDSVMVITGRERGKTGKVLRVIPERNGAIIERVNLVKRHTRPRGPQQSGGILEKEAPVRLSNLMIMCDKCNAPVRVGRKILASGEKVRICRRCGEPLE
jgi:large subunit ribosomal protein L24